MARFVAYLIPSPKRWYTSSSSLMCLKPVISFFSRRITCTNANQGVRRIGTGIIAATGAARTVGVESVYHAVSKLPR